MLGTFTRKTITMFVGKRSYNEFWARCGNVKSLWGEFRRLKDLEKNPPDLSSGVASTSALQRRHTQLRVISFVLLAAMAYTAFSITNAHYLTSLAWGFSCLFTLGLIYYINQRNLYLIKVNIASKEGPVIPSNREFLAFVSKSPRHIFPVGL